MIILNENYVRGKSKNVNEILFNESLKFDERITYDVFISHSYRDKEIIKGLYGIFSKLGYRVYIDWIEDSSLDRNNVNKETAKLLKKRMKNCKSLVYVFSKNVVNSKWCPWELGLADGIHGKVCVLNLDNNESGLEYLELYPKLSIGHNPLTDKEDLWIDYPNKLFSVWVNRTKEM